MDGFLAERVISELPDGLRDVDVFEEMVILLGFEEDVFFPAGLEMLFDLAPADVHPEAFVLALDGLGFAGLLVFIHLYIL